MSIAGQSTVFKHGTHAAVSSNTDYSSSILGVGFKLNGEDVDATTFGNAFRDYEPSFINGEVNVTYKHAAAMLTVLGDIITNRDTVTWELAPTGTATGESKISGSMIPTSFDFNLDVGSLEKYAVTFRTSNTVTFTVY